MVTDTEPSEVQEWARRALADELTWAREASTAGRRAYHEGIAAALAYAAGDVKRATAMLTAILVDYAGVRNVQGRRGYEQGVVMTRGVSSYIDKRGAVNLAAWETEQAAAADA